MGIFKEKKIIVPEYCIFLINLLSFLNMEQLQIAFSPYYEVIRDKANGFEKLLIYTNRFK